VFDVNQQGAESCKTQLKSCVESCSIDQGPLADDCAKACQKEYDACDAPNALVMSEESSRDKKCRKICIKNCGGQAECIHDCKVAQRCVIGRP